MNPTRTVLSSDKYELLSLTLQKAGLARHDRIPRRPAGPTSPLSFAQQRFWFMDQLEPGNTQYNIFVGGRLQGRLNAEVLRQSLQEIVRRHEILRAVFPTVDGVPQQSLLPEDGFSVAMMDLRDIPQSERDSRAQSITEEEFARPFDLAVGPLVRVLLLRLSEDEHWLVATAHHTVFDGWSSGIFLQELATLYEAFIQGISSPLPELPIQYSDFAQWQLERAQGKLLQEQVDYWKQKLNGVPEVLNLHTDRPRPAVQRFRGRHEDFSFPGSLARSLHELAGRQRTTIFVVLMSALQVLLHRYSGQQDLLISSGIANRNRSEIEPLIGCFINILLLRANLAGRPSFVEVLDRTHESVLEAHAHQDLPFEQLVAVLRPQRDLSYSPLAQVMMVLHNTGAPALGFHDIRFSGIPAPENRSAQYDLLINFGSSEDELLGGISYNSDLFDATTVVRMIRNLETLLGSAVESPTSYISSLRSMHEDEQRQVVFTNNRTERDFPQKCLHELFEEQARRDPEAIAIITGKGSLKYGDLNSRANVLAKRLQRSGIAPGAIVAICLHRSVELVTGLLAILKSGGAYLPLDPDYPADRLSFMLEDSGAKVLITHPGSLLSVKGNGGKQISLEHDWEHIPDLSVPNPCSGVTADDLAYIIYTSGSTGRPKAAMLDHRGRVNNFFDFNSRFHIGSGDRLIALSSPSFDMCAYDVFGTLAAGAAIVLPQRSCDRDPKHWAELMIRHDVSIWHSVPSLLELLVDSQENLSNPPPFKDLRVVLLGGDWIAVTLPDRIRKIASAAQIVSLGGATEVSMDSTIYIVGETSSSWSSIPYGKPMTNQLAYVVDPFFEAMPIGVPGELCLGGVGVGRGYRDRPDLTAEKFIPHPFSRTPGERIYRTGDIARWLADGNLELLGRIDNQVKIRGFRIELGEVKAALERHPAVREAEVLMTGSNSASKKLVGYIVPKGNAPLTGDVQAFLRSALPAYMVPNTFVILEALPLSPNGKVDRRALPAPEVAQIVSQENTDLANAAEAEIRRVWSDLLHRKEIGLDDDFFELGGDSFQGITMLQRLPSRVSLVDFLKKPTIRSLARCCSQECGDKQSLLLQLTKQPKSGPPVLVCVPYDGGSAIVFQPLASALGQMMDVRAVMRPGHDLDQQDAAFETIEQLAHTCVEEIKKWVKAPVYLYGHCGGSALTIELARLLEREKVELKGVFIGAAYPQYTGRFADLLSRLIEPNPSDEHILRYIQSLGGIGQDAETSGLHFVARAFRHDGACAEQYFKSFARGWPSERIAAPIVCIIALDDPLTKSYKIRSKRWKAFSPSVELVTLKNGGHYFVKGRADTVAEIILARCNPTNLASGNHEEHTAPTALTQD